MKNIRVDWMESPAVESVLGYEVFYSRPGVASVFHSQTAQNFIILSPDQLGFSATDTVSVSVSAFNATGDGEESDRVEISLIEQVPVLPLPTKVVGLTLRLV